jgi:hypothetical protein
MTARGRAIDIAPGEAIYVPILAPHWVQTHDAVSVSLSLTWRSEWSFHHADACRFNRRLRARAEPGRAAPLSAKQSPEILCPARAGADRDEVSAAIAGPRLGKAARSE